MKMLSLIGFQACGKTTLGRLLANDLKLPFVDIDQWIEQLYPSLSCREIFQTLGAEHFRDLESQAILTLLKDDRALVLATGGGSLLRACNAENLKAKSVLIYLKTSPEILKERIWRRQALPAYLDPQDPHQSFAHLYQDRCLIYEKWAHHTIEMDSLNIEDALYRLNTIGQGI